MRKHGQRLCKQQLLVAIPSVFPFSTLFRQNLYKGRCTLPPLRISRFGEGTCGGNAGDLGHLVPACSVSGYPKCLAGVLLYAFVVYEEFLRKTDACKHMCAFQIVFPRGCRALGPSWSDICSISLFGEGVFYTRFGGGGLHSVSTSVWAPQ